VVSPSTHLGVQPLVKSDCAQFSIVLVNAFLQVGSASGGGPGMPTPFSDVAKDLDTKMQKAIDIGICIVDFGVDMIGLQSLGVNEFFSGKLRA
jgi:hypothetical protein